MSELTEYALTEDEKEMIDSTAAYHQEEANREINSFLAMIIRRRKLAAANWTLKDGKLVRADAVVVEPSKETE